MVIHHCPYHCQHVRHAGYPNLPPACHALTLHPYHQHYATYPQTYYHMTSTTSYFPTTIKLDVEDSDYARTFTETITHPWGAWPERLKAVVDVLKERLGSGGECAARALKLITALPFSALADLEGEITKVADGTRWADYSTRVDAAYFLPQVAEAKAARDEVDKERNWDAWQAMYGRSGAAWVPPPMESAYAYPKMPEVECPTNPSGWRFVMFPEPFMRHMETGGAYPWHR
ncbi:hypothetical protein CcaverHIS641_0109760 [Cutaneotrichosporon cavernicola]|nr:hypothetical protein CcaverHIS641_0109760 [Cutaneotrichosporon cavernicola]